MNSVALQLALEEGGCGFHGCSTTNGGVWCMAHFHLCSAPALYLIHLAPKAHIACYPPLQHQRQLSLNATGALLSTVHQHCVTILSTDGTGGGVEIAEKEGTLCPTWDTWQEIDVAAAFDPQGLWKIYTYCCTPQNVLHADIKY
eukprot:15365867-Ditylum_brightwellii.AAC.1